MQERRLGIYGRTSIIRDADLPETITQQRDAGIAFAKANGVDYKVYLDEGKSGYKVEDEDNPFKNRPEFEELLKDIKQGNINEVWVWSTSRLSRNNQYFISILSYFEKYKTTLYVQNARYEVTDPTTKAMLSMMGVFNEFDRMTIVSNTHRGQVTAFNEGRNRYSNLFGYYSEHDGKKITTLPLPEELEQVKTIYNLYLNEHWSLGKIGQQIFASSLKKKNKKLVNNHGIVRIKAILQQFVYTSESLKTDGREILKQFREGLIPDLQELRKDDYWVTSAYYKEKVITREEWIEANERLIHLRQSVSNRNKNKLRERNTSLGTAFLKCPECNVKYYYKDLKKKGGLSYVHLRTYDKCSNLSQFRMKKFDTIIDVYYTFYYLILDNRKEKLEEMKIELTDQKKTLKGQLAQLKSERDKKSKRIEKLEENLDNDEIDNISVIVKQIDRMTNERDKIESDIIILEKELEEIARKETDLVSMEKYSVGTLDLLRNWFELRNQNDYGELHRLLRESLGNDLFEVRKDVVSIHGIHFNFKHDYNVIYPFIEELLGIKLNKTYSEFEQLWIDAHQKEIKEFPEKVNYYLMHRFDKPDSGHDYEDFDLKYLIKAGSKFDNVLTTRTPDFKFLTSCLRPDLYNNGIGLWSAPEEVLANVKYYTAKQIALKLGNQVVSVREFGRRHGVLIKGKNRQYWTEEDLQKYIKARERNGYYC